jgi:hypothetical protein
VTALRAIAVTAADERYAELALGLIDSLSAARAGLDVGVLDLGLGAASRTRLSRVATLVSPPWHFRPHSNFDRDLKWRSRSARPFLRDLFPGYRTYVWLDADTFVQSATGLEWLIQAAVEAGVAVVPAVDRSYSHPPRQIDWVRKRYDMAFGPEIAADLMRLPYINSGVFAVVSGSPLWSRWAARFQAALDRWDGDFLSDQAVLNGTIALDGIAHGKLPAVCNWICHLAMPRWLSKRRLFVEPSPPYSPILIVHNTLDRKDEPRRLFDERGQPHELKIAFSTVRAGGA